MPRGPEVRTVPSCLPGMTLFTISNKAWLNVEGTLTPGIGPNAASRAQGWRRVGRHNSTGNRLAVDTTQREIDWHKKTIGMYEGLIRKTSTRLWPAATRRRMLHCDRLRSHAFVW